MKKLLAAWAMLACLMGATEPKPADPLRLEPIVSAFMFPGVDTAIRWDECGEVNAYYNYRDKQVTMCKELLDLDPGFVRFVLAHELAHGVIRQLNVAFTGSEEDAADELAAFVLGALEQADDVMAAADVFGSLEDGIDVPWDEHMAHSKRAYVLGCFAFAIEGLTGEGSACEAKWRRLVRSWNYLLKLE